VIVQYGSPLAALEQLILFLEMLIFFSKKNWNIKFLRRKVKIFFSISYEYSIFEMKNFKIEVTLVLQYVGTKEFQISRHFT
jgi:hypothetical protein